MLINDTVVHQDGSIPTSGQILVYLHSDAFTDAQKTQYTEPMRQVAVGKDGTFTLNLPNLSTYTQVAAPLYKVVFLTPEFQWWELWNVGGGSTGKILDVRSYMHGLTPREVEALNMKLDNAEDDMQTAYISMLEMQLKSVLGVATLTANVATPLKITLDWTKLNGLTFDNKIPTFIEVVDLGSEEVLYVTDITAEKLAGGSTGAIEIPEGTYDFAIRVTDGEVAGTSQATVSATVTAPEE